MSAFSELLNQVKDFSFDDVVKSYYVSGETISGINGFTFSVMKEEEISLSSNITDYPVESGSFVENNITLMPERVKLSGDVAEVTYGDDLILGMLDTLSSSLIPVTALSPALCNATQEIMNQLRKFHGEATKLKNQIKSFVDIANKASELMGFGGGGEQLTRQQKAYAYLEACWKARKFLSIDTPWRTFEDMVIEDLRFTQGADSKTYSGIEVSFKRIVLPETRLNENVKVKAGRASSEVESTSQPVTVAPIEEVPEIDLGTDDFLVDAIGAVPIPMGTMNLREAID